MKTVQSKKSELKKPIRILRAFRSKNYRLYFVGQGISMIGTWMTLLATSWVVYELTESALVLGVVGFLSQISTFFLAPFAGVLVDRWSRHHILIITQILSMIQSLILALLALTNTINIWHIIFLNILQGLVNVVNMPTSQAFVNEIVEEQEDLGNAIALNSSMMSSARLIGPAIAGFLIASVGAGACFLIDGISYIAVIISLLAIKLTPKERVVQTTPVWQRLKEGFFYSFGFPPFRAILLMLALLGFMGLPYTILSPIFAKEILHGGSETLGFLMAASAMGAFIASVYLSSRSTVVGLEKAVALAPALLGSGFIVFSLSRTLWFSLLAMVVIGFSVVFQLASSNTVLQTIVDEDKRGRLMSFCSMAFMGMVPFGNLFSGWLASKIGAPNTLMINGIFCILGSLIFIKQLKLLTRLIRPIYVKLGLVPNLNT